MNSSNGHQQNQTFIPGKSNTTKVLVHHQMKKHRNIFQTYDNINSISNTSIEQMKKQLILHLTRRKQMIENNGSTIMMKLSLLTINLQRSGSMILFIKNWSNSQEQTVYEQFHLWLMDLNLDSEKSCLLALRKELPLKLKLRNFQDMLLSIQPIIMEKHPLQEQSSILLKTLLVQTILVFWIQ